MDKVKKDKFKREFGVRLVKFSVGVIRFTKEFTNDRALWPVADQLIRSATSIGANIIEAKASSSKKDYLKFFEIALKSANETLYWLVVVREYNQKLKDSAMHLEKEVQELCKIIGTSVLTLKGKKKL